MRLSTDAGTLDRDILTNELTLKKKIVFAALPDRLPRLEYRQNRGSNLQLSQHHARSGRCSATKLAAAGCCCGG